MWASQFLQQFKLDVRYKPGKKQIFPDSMSCLGSANTGYADPHHSELDALFTYSTTLVKVHPALISQILAHYKADLSWTWLLQQIQANNNYGANAIILLFVIGSTLPTDSNSYLSPWSDGDEELFFGYIPAPKTSKNCPFLISLNFSTTQIDSQTYTICVSFYSWLQIYWQLRIVRVI